MRIVDRWLRHPQQVWARKALFQIHLWIGIGVGLYVFVISVTGSLVVFRIELDRALAPAKYVAVVPPALAETELRARAEKVMKGWRVIEVWPSRRANKPVEVILQRGRFQRDELFDPYTGASLGEAIPQENRAVKWLVDVHDNLLGGKTGRMWNGIGSVCVLVLCITGAVIWWPGISTWRRSLMLHRKVGWKRLTWDLHASTGFWIWLFLVVWALSGIYLAFPNPFNVVVNYFEPLDTATFPRVGDTILVWLPRLHFGRFAGNGTKAVWVVLGLAPVVLVVTGALMWWNRVLSKRLWDRADSSQPEAAESTLALTESSR